MKKISELSGSTLVLLLGIVVFLLGSIQPMRYENAIANGYEVDAKIVDIEIVEDYDVVEECDVTEYHIYVDYTVDGEEYTHIKAEEKTKLNGLWVGDTMKLVVNPNKPEKKMFDGGILATAGLLIIGYGIYCVIQDKRKKKKAALEAESAAENTKTN